jgi:uncharacterized membrane protein HdeD (DUF308 family)
MKQEKSNLTDSNIPGGTILSLIGIMVLLTPLVTDLTTKGLVMDLIAGAVLLVTGITSIIFGLRRKL